MDKPRHPKFAVVVALTSTNDVATITHKREVECFEATTEGFEKAEQHYDWILHALRTKEGFEE